MSKSTYKLLLITETVFIALAITGVFVFYDYKTGAIPFPPDLIHIVGIIIEFIFFLTMIFGLFGWVFIFDEYNRRKHGR